MAMQFSPFRRRGMKRRSTARQQVIQKLRRTGMEIVRLPQRRFQLAMPRGSSRPSSVKSVDTDLTLAPVIDTTSTNASVFVLNLIVPGTASFNRVGRKITMQSARLYGNFIYDYVPAATTLNLNANQVRMVLVYDKQPSGIIPSFDTIFGHTLPDGTEACNFRDPRRYDNFDRFRVLRDVVETFVPRNFVTGGTVNDTAELRSFDVFVPLRGLTSNYSGQSSPQTISDISSGALYVYFRADVNTTGVVTIGVRSDSFARLRYSDAQ